MENWILRVEIVVWRAQSVVRLFIIVASCLYYDLHSFVFVLLLWQYLTDEELSRVLTGVRIPFMCIGYTRLSVPILGVLLAVV